MQVSDLIVDNSWNSDLIKDIFNSQDIDSILSMPIIFPNQLVELVWNFSRDGNYTVKSSYHYIMRSLLDTSHLHVSGPWNSIWQLQLPHKYKVMLWRLVHDVLPLRQRLVQKGVQCPSLCPFCESSFESSWHAFFDCAQVQTVWMEAGHWATVRSITANADSFSDAFFKLLEVTPCQQRNDVALIFWCIWRRRNEKVWEGIQKDPKASICMTRDAYHEWNSIHSAKSETSSVVANNPDCVLVCRWAKLPPGFYKCNIDAALFNDHGSFGIGLCIRDSEGNFVKAKTIVYHGKPPVHEAEAIGLLVAINWLLELQYVKVILELDCKHVVDSIMSGRRNLTEFGSIIKQCKNKLPFFQSHVVGFTRRQADHVAHTLARASRSFASHQIFYLISTCIETFILNEMI